MTHSLVPIYFICLNYNSVLINYINCLNCINVRDYQRYSLTANKSLS